MKCTCGPSEVKHKPTCPSAFVAELDAVQNKEELVELCEKRGEQLMALQRLHDEYMGKGLSEDAQEIHGRLAAILEDKWAS